MHLPPPPLTFARNLNFNSYFAVERNHIISYSPVIRFLFFFSLSLSLFQTEAVYIAEGFPIKSVITQSISCNSSLNITLELSFDTGIPSGKTIEGVYQAALKDGNITSLTENNTIYTFSCK